MTNPADMVANRKTVRKAYASLLKTYMGTLVQEVYAYQVKTFQKQSPVICVVSAGAGRNRIEGVILPDCQFLLNIHIFVAYIDSASGWTEENSEDMIDDIEAAHAGFIVKYGDQQESDTASWLYLETIGRSDITEFLDGGLAYRHEMVPVIVTALNVG